MAFITLTEPAHVGGILRHPHEGALEVTDEEAGRVVDNHIAIDVTADFADQPAARPSAKGGATKE